jgi:hypothetical protein
LGSVRVFQVQAGADIHIGLYENTGTPEAPQFTRLDFNVGNGVKVGGGVDCNKEKKSEKRERGIIRKEYNRIKENSTATAVTIPNTQLTFSPK